jgi:hypothetical protein
MSEPTFYRWNEQSAEMGMVEICRLKQLHPPRHSVTSGCCTRGSA